jgi:hypothetical protein
MYYELHLKLNQDFEKIVRKSSNFYLMFYKHDQTSNVVSYKDKRWFIIRNYKRIRLCYQN